ncbi:MAG: tetratricopeptide repeat protein [Hormoscilla sp. SP5CHS1]|nr:tetratricopeptide repeat protein [Hormoscilla sp. SP12CHS1]MBC6453678.1 tetratricopeptide repeat protein [Hormoscilla sp. SP5CHS1]
MKAQENGESVKAIQLYEQVLDNNPNHFSALFEIADLYWESQKFDKAVDIYTRAFKVNPVRTGDNFARSLLSYGRELLLEKKLEQAAI